VALADIDDDSALTVTEALSRSGHKAVAIHCNVADEAEVAAMVEQTVPTFGRLDAAFNNAGVQVSIGRNSRRPEKRPRRHWVGWPGRQRCVRGESQSRAAA
jgi:NAD(P)-dependent dehydrogenase (short-subunit alcohol dehydrogenase family)